VSVKRAQQTSARGIIASGFFREWSAVGLQNRKPTESEFRVFSWAQAIADQGLVQSSVLPCSPNAISGAVVFLGVCLVVLNTEAQRAQRRVRRGAASRVP